MQSAPSPNFKPAPSAALAAIQAEDARLKEERAARELAAAVPAEPERHVMSGRDEIDGRQSARDYYRSRSFRGTSTLLPEEKYHIDPRDIPEGCACVWVPTSLVGMPTGMVQLYIRNGWVPARACDFPQHSHYGENISEAIREATRMKAVLAEDPIVKDEQMLFVRAAEMSKEAEVEHIRETNYRTQSLLNRLRSNSALPQGKGQGYTETSQRQYAVETDSIDRAMGEV